jgi:hypothetical protein
MKPKCNTKFCRNAAAHHRKFCNTCVSKKKRAKNPVRYAYDVLKMNAKRRGKHFGITFKEFQKFARRSDYLAGKGRRKESYTIDRIDNSKGYVIGNLQILTLSQNSKKANRVLYYDYKTKYATVI